MTIRAKLYTAIVVVIAGLALTAGVGITAMSRLGDRFDSVQRAADARALALQLKFDVTDFNGWQTAYGYDDGKSRPIYLASFERFRRDFAAGAGAAATRRARRSCSIASSVPRTTSTGSMRGHGQRSALGARRRSNGSCSGPELVNFGRAAAAAEALAQFETAQAAAQDASFRDARSDALRLLVLASIVAALLVFILLLTASDLARRAEGQLEDETEHRPERVALSRTGGGSRSVSPRRRARSRSPVRREDRPTTIRPRTRARAQRA